MTEHQIDLMIDQLLQEDLNSKWHDTKNFPINKFEEAPAFYAMIMVIVAISSIATTIITLTA